MGLFEVWIRSKFGFVRLQRCWVPGDLCIFINSPKGCKFFFFERFPPFHTHTPISLSTIVNRFRFDSRGRSYSRASPRISIGRTAVVVVHGLYLELHQYSALPVRLQSRESNPRRGFKSFGHLTKALALSFWTCSFRWVPNHQEPEKHIDKSNDISWVRTRAAYLAV